MRALQPLDRAGRDCVDGAEVGPHPSKTRPGLLSRQGLPECACHATLLAHPFDADRDTHGEEDDEDKGNDRPVGDREWSQPQEPRRDSCADDNDSAEHGLERVRRDGKCTRLIGNGRLVTAMSHPSLGRSLIKRLAYGSSIPEIDVADIAGHAIRRLGDPLESKIAGLAEEAARARSEADILKRRMAAKATVVYRVVLSRRMTTIADRR